MEKRTGIVDWFDSEKGYGFIKPEDAEESLFVHQSDVEDNDMILVSGEVVTFTLGENTKGPTACQVKRQIDRYRGVVESFDPNKGYGWIEPEDEDKESVFVHYTSIVSGREYRDLKEDQEVEYSLGAGKDGKLQATLVRADNRRPLEKFAYLPSFPDKLEQLANLAQDEEWNFRFHESGHPLPILYSYVHYTFKRIQHEGKIAFTQEPERDSQIACFNTGLVTNYYNPIFGAFHENKHPDATAPYVLIGFCEESSHPITLFASRPEPANYFTNPADLVYDRKLELVTNVHHIIDERLERFPARYHDKPQELAEDLDRAVARAEKRVLQNYKTAIPYFGRGKINLLLPLCLQDPTRADVALVVAREGAVYKGYTVLTLDMAYNNARLLAKPDKEWLIP